jgi:hypothetical protein
MSQVSVTDVSHGLERPCAAMEPHDVVVCRLRAPVETIQERIRVASGECCNEASSNGSWSWTQTLDAAAVEGFSLLNDGCSATRGCPRDAHPRRLAA